MLSQEQRKTLRNLSIFRSEGDVAGISITIPSPYKLCGQMTAMILSNGFKTVKRAAPNEANIIIRVYQSVHHHHEANEYYSMYGAECYVRELENEKTWKKGEWITENNKRIYPIDYLHNRIRVQLFPDEWIKYDPDFIDFYFMVS